MPAIADWVALNLSQRLGLTHLTDKAKGGLVEQLNIEGKRSGDGLVCHKERLVNALARVQSPILKVIDFELGRKGFMGYLKALGGSNIVKIVPSNGSASDSQAIKRLKVVCGSNTGYLDDKAWMTKGMEHSEACELRVSPHYAVTPNLSGIELAEALAKVLPFVSPKKDERMALKCVHLRQKEGKLTLTACNGFAVAEVELDFSDGEADALWWGDVAKSLLPALRKAKRVNLGFENGKLVFQTEAVRYTLKGYDSTYPDTDKLYPKEFVAEARFDTREVLRASVSLSALSLDKESAIILAIGDGKMRACIREEKGEAQIEAEAQGEAKIAFSHIMLLKALRALGDTVVRLQVANGSTPALFTVDGYRVLLAPMLIDQTKPAPKAKEEAKPQAPVIAEAEKIARAHEAKHKPKHKHSRAKQPVAV